MSAAPEGTQPRAQVSQIKGSRPSHFDVKFTFDAEELPLPRGARGCIYIPGVGSLFFPEGSAVPADAPAILAQLRRGTVTVGAVVDFIASHSASTPYVERSTPAGDASTFRDVANAKELKRSFHVIVVSNQVSLENGTEPKLRKRFIFDDTWPQDAPLTGAAVAATQAVFLTFDTAGVAELINRGVPIAGEAASVRRKPKIMLMCGAGISVAAGIPDFRTPGTGLYSRLAKYKLPTPESLFTIDYLRNRPELFYEVADDMQLWPGYFPPTHVHHFIAMLHERDLLLRCYTQNIDCLEREAGVPGDALVEAHGTFATAKCIDCKKAHDVEWVRELAKRREVPRCPACNGIVKPDVVFFGESLPSRFFQLLQGDVERADLLIVLGTSLQVYPFAAIHDMVACPRVLVNRDRAGDFDFASDDTAIPGADGTPFVRDVFLSGDCQTSIQQLAEALGFGRELTQRYEAGKVACAAKKQNAVAAANL